jgi:MYXO-CTERM domain-containing protein
MRAWLVIGSLLLVGLEARAAELLVFDWDKPVTTANHGFPWDQPPMENGDWTTPVNYAGGTLHYRVEIHSQPVAQDMKLQFCFWQQTPSRENCGPLQQVKGTPGTVATWSVAVGSMWKKDGLPIEWTLPRYRNGVAIKDINGNPVSDYAGWNWNGHDPDDWYPLDMRFTVVVVENGKTFSGWSNYVTPTPDAGVPTPDSAPPKPDSAPPKPDSAPPVPDAGPTGDSTAPATDGGLPPGDSGPLLDAPAVADRGTATEVGTPPDDARRGGSTLEGGSGCSIGTAPSGSAGPLLLLTLMVLGVAWLRPLRDRRRHGGCAGRHPRR